MFVLPTPAKRFYLEFTGKREFSAFFDGLWQQAEKALASSEKVVICGYSMPDADQRASALLLQAINKNSRITILSRRASEEVARRFHDSGHVTVTALSEPRFEEWVLSNSCAGATGLSANNTGFELCLD